MCLEEGKIRWILKEIAEKIYWKYYKNKVCKSRVCFSGIEVASEAVLEEIIQWTGRMDPMARFATALKEIGVVFPIVILNGHKVKDGCQLCLKELSKEDKKDIILRNDGSFSTMTILQENEFIQEIKYDSKCWRVDTYETVNQGLQIKYTNKRISINNEFLEEYFFVYEISRFSKYESRKLLFEECSEITNGIKQEIATYLKEVEEIKVYDIYNIIKDVISSTYNLEEAVIEISSSENMAKFQGGKLLEYKDNYVKRVPYSGYVHKEYRNESGAQCIYENGQYKISGVEREKIESFMQEADRAIAKVENLDF